MSAFRHFDSLITKIQSDELDMPTTKEEFAAQIDEEIAAQNEALWAEIMYHLPPPPAD